MSDEINKDDLDKALNVLQDLAKGHNSRGTATTQVDSMREGGVGAGSDSGSTQVYHTPSNSNPGGWAGSSEHYCPDDGATDAIKEDGTDYQGGAQMAKSILDKLSKGQQLTAEEFSFVAKGGMAAYAMNKDDKNKEDEEKSVESVDKAQDNDDDDEDDKNGKKGKPFGKSLEEVAAENDTVREGMEVSEFLAEFVGTINKALKAQEQRLTERFINAMASESGKTEDFNKSLASALSNFGEALVANTQRVEQIESTPARAPKSQQVQPVNKSFAGSEGAEDLTKSQVAATMVNMVESNKIDAQEVIRFESNGGLISDETMAKVLAHRNGN